MCSGVCKDITSPRTWGNEIATAAAYLRADLEDPVERVKQTATSCGEAVAYRRQVGFELTEKTSATQGGSDRCSGFWRRTACRGS